MNMSAWCRTVVSLALLVLLVHTSGCVLLFTSSGPDGVSSDTATDEPWGADGGLARDGAANVSRLADGPSLDGLTPDRSQRADSGLPHDQAASATHDSGLTADQSTGSCPAAASVTTLTQARCTWGAPVAGSCVGTCSCFTNLDIICVKSGTNLVCNCSRKTSLTFYCQRQFTGTCDDYFSMDVSDCFASCVTGT